MKKEKAVEIVVTPEMEKELSKNLEIGTTWNPEPKSKIFGKVISFKNHTGKYGTKVTKTRFIELLQNGGVVTIVWLKTVLETKFKELKIKEEDVIGIEYVGEVKKGKGKSYHSYNVAKYNS
ncbi:MAG: hypothetical protein M0P71_16175 [Melioribacteraceae bacterium]|jgi:hypothetical protein|nr:hypothetical protein [Melioribacteraceae bacterium]